MNTRLLIAGVFGMALVAAPASAAPDALLDALLGSTMANLPAALSQPRAASIALKGDDTNSGVVGIVEVTFKGNDPGAKVDFVVLADAVRAAAYAKRFDSMIRGAGAKPVFLPFAPGAECASQVNEGKMICAAQAERVVVFSFGKAAESTDKSASGPAGLAGPLIRAGLDHLRAVEKASGKS